LARRLKRRFVDLDRVIENSAGLKVKRIFREKGELYFRTLEKEALAQVLEQEGQIIATGGGVVTDQENLNLLREKAFLICLTASIDALLKRVGKGSKRPLLRGPDRRDRIDKLLKERGEKYALAHSSVDTTDLTVDQVVDKIIELLTQES
jgi:shikimate kinase